MGISGFMRCSAWHWFDNRAEEKSPAFGAERLGGQRLGAVNDRGFALGAVESPPAVLQCEAMSRGAIGCRAPSCIAFEFTNDSPPHPGALARQTHVPNLQRLLFFAD